MSNTKSNNETPKKRRVVGGPGKMNGAETGRCFTSENQPSSDAKKKGWAKRKFTRQVLTDLLNMQYKFTPESAVKQQLINAFGDQILDMTVGEVMSLQQAQKAILKGDSIAFSSLLNQAFGMPKQEVETSEKKIKVTRK